MKSIILAAILMATPAAAYAKAQQPLAEVNGKAISRAEAEKRLWAIYGEKMTDALITEEVMLQTAAKFNIKPDAKDLALELAEMKKSYGGEDGYKAALARHNMTEREVRTNIEQQQMIRAVVKKLSGVNITDADAEKFFNENKDKFAAPTAVQLRQMLLASKTKASDMLAALKAGADFEKLAKEVSDDPAAKQTGGEMGYVDETSLIEPVAIAIAKLTPGGLSDVLEVDGKFYIIKVEGRKPSVPAQFGAVREQIKQTLEQSAIDKTAGQIIEKLRGEAKIKNYYIEGK
ncbi:MAG: peptidyl-prolyl cis-trans isomerase [Elusimicrobiaceae bacterium]